MYILTHSNVEETCKLCKTKIHKGNPVVINIGDTLCIRCAIKQSRERIAYLKSKNPASYSLLRTQLTLNELETIAIDIIL